MNAREVALKVINHIENQGAYANIALGKELQGKGLSEQDRRFVTELVYGTVKASRTLDWMLGHYVSRPVDKISPVIRNILRMGLYQLFFLTKVPASAACNQSVELAKKYGHAGTVKFVNGVLRGAARAPEKAQYPEREAQPALYLSLRYFHPEWLTARWITRLGLTAAEKLCQINNETPALSVRTNTLKNNRETLLTALAAEGVACTPSAWTPEGVTFQAFPSLSSLTTLQQGLFQVQDESSMLVAHVVDPQPGECIIDTCAAPGGKSTHMAALMKNQGKIIACDIYEHKLALIRENTERLGISIIDAKLQDALLLGSTYAGQADRVLVDAPCSGLGVLRRKPDSRWKKKEELLAELPQLQRQILHSAAACVKPGGILVYSTCTTEPEENEQVVKGFLAEHPEFSLQQTGCYLPVAQPERDMVQLWPHTDGVDGFFIARMQRKAGA